MLDKIGGAKIDALTLSEESARREAAKPQPTEPQPPHHETAVPPGTAARTTVIPVTLESRGKQVLVTSAGMAKVLADADRLVSFVASRRSGRKGSESGSTSNG